MTKPAGDANRRWPGLLLAVAVAVLVTLLGAGTASAATTTAAQTRVGAYTLVAQVVVGPDCGISAGQRLDKDRPTLDFVLATGAAAKTGAEGFGGLTRAAEYGGVRPYNALRGDLKGTELQAHHLIEQRFARVVGQSPKDMPSVAVTQSEHQVFTNAWRKAIPYGANGTGMATGAQIDGAAGQIYAGYPNLLSALGLG